MRATRAYLAGLGTSGSLVAGAALLFVLGSAIVAFRGWPQIATGPVTSAVVAPGVAPPPSRVARRLAVVLSRVSLVRVVRGGPASHRRRLAGAAVPGGGRGVSSTSPGAGTSGGAPGTAASAAGSAAPACGSSQCTGSGSQSEITHLAGVVAQQVSSVGGTAASQVQAGSGTVAGAVSGVSPPAGNVVQSGGDTTAGAVTGVATTTASAVSQVGSAAGGGGH